MRRHLCILISLVFFPSWFPSLLLAAEKTPPEIRELADSEIVGFGTDPVIVAAVKAQNAAKISLAEIRKMDQKWITTPGIAPFVKALMESECGMHLRDIQKKTPFYAEIFVMDSQGALVAATDKTSDYWQGDEAKFTESFNDSKGGIHISDIEFDESAQVYIVQVSVPVTDSGTVVGALTVGIDLDMMEQMQGRPGSLSE
ncbi:MAG: PDC sensor domain-containing protein [Desulfobacterales bacterium]